MLVGSRPMVLLFSAFLHDDKHCQVLLDLGTRRENQSMINSVYFSIFFLSGISTGNSLRDFESTKPAFGKVHLQCSL